MTDSFEKRLDAVYRAGGDQALLDRVYDEWARDYEKDLWSSGSPYIALAIGLVERYVASPNARILDGGCGPGVLVSILRMIGYDNVVGIDASDGMLAVARSKGCYAELHKMLVAEQIDFPDDSFDAVILSGVLTIGHAPPEALDGITRIAKPGAPIIFSMSEAGYEQFGFREKISALTKAKVWQLQEKTEPFRTYPFLEQHAQRRLWINVYRKAGDG